MLAITYTAGSLNLNDVEALRPPDLPTNSRNDGKKRDHQNIHWEKMPEQSWMI